MKIAIDLDEVLGDFVGAFLRWYNHNYEDKLTKPDIVKYYLRDLLGWSAKYELGVMYRFFDEGGIATIQPMEGAQEAIKQLAKDHELYLVTGRQSRLQQETEEWIDRYFPNTFKAIVLANQNSLDGGETRDKGEMCKELGCTLLIDDNSWHVEPVMRVGVNVIILNHPWNGYHRLPASVLRADNWEEIVQAVGKLADRD